MRLHASVINLNKQVSKSVRNSATFEGLAYRDGKKESIVVFYSMLYLMKDCHAIYIRLRTPNSMRSSGLVP